jgi:hypothetical protein
MRIRQIFPNPTSSALTLIAFSTATALLPLTALRPSATVRFTARLICHNVVSGVSGKGGRASAGATATGYAANHASIRVGKMCVWRVCPAAYGLQNLVCM